MQRKNYAFLSDQNQRDENEDSFLIVRLFPFGVMRPLIFLGIADGMGGHEHGEYVSRESLRRISLSLFEQLTVAPALNSFATEAELDAEILGRALLDAVEQTNAHVLRMILSNKWGRAGSTIVAAAIYGDTAVAVNLGDSPLFHYRASEGTLAQATTDHNVAGALMRAGLITQEMARIHEGSDRLEFFLGNEAMPRESPVVKIKLSERDLLLLCSDGISGSLSLEQINGILNNGVHSIDSQGDLNLLAEELLEASTAAGESDNQTLILWRHESADTEPRSTLRRE